MAMPIIVKIIVGVNPPVSGIGGAVGVGIAEGLALATVTGVAVGVGTTVGATVGARVWDGVASNAGTSPAWTINVLVMTLVIPVASIQETVNLCVPDGRLVGGVQVQVPLLAILKVSVIGSDSTVMVTDCPAGPLPKNEGLLLVITSPSVMLSKMTLVGVGVPVNTGKENLDSF